MLAALVIAGVVGTPDLTAAAGASSWNARYLTVGTAGVSAGLGVSVPLENARVGMWLGLQEQPPRPPPGFQVDYGYLYFFRFGPTVSVDFMTRLRVTFALLYEQLVTAPQTKFGVAALAAGTWRFPLNQRWWVGPRLELLVGSDVGYGGALQVSIGVEP